MIELKNVSLIIKHEKIIDNVSYRFIDNKIYGLQGRNGSGKSMLLSIIAGLTKPTAGSVQADGAMLFKDRDFPESIGALINTPGMINSMSGYDNLKLLAEIKNEIGDEEISAYMERFSLEPRSRKHVRSYSLGMKQKLGIIAAVMEHPHIILLDEPTNALDSRSIVVLNEVIKEEKAHGALVIVTSHDKEELQGISDIFLKMEDGKLHEEAK